MHTHHPPPSPSYPSTLSLPSTLRSQDRRAGRSVKGGGIYKVPSPLVGEG
jgi:hypothetical protein